MPHSFGKTTTSPKSGTWSIELPEWNAVRIGTAAILGFVQWEGGGGTEGIFAGKEDILHPGGNPWRPPLLG